MPLAASRSSGGRIRGRIAEYAGKKNAALVDHGHRPHAGTEDGNGEGADQHPVFAVGKGSKGAGEGHTAILGRASGAWNASGGIGSSHGEHTGPAGAAQCGADRRKLWPCPASGGPERRSYPRRTRQLFRLVLG